MAGQEGDKGFNKRFVAFCEKAILILFSIFAVLLTLYSITNGYAVTRFNKSLEIPGEILALSLGSLFLLTAAFAFFRLTAGLKKYQLTILFHILLMLMAAIHVLLLLNIRSFPSTDSLIVVDQADYLAFHPGSIITSDSYYAYYYSMFSNNNFLTLLYAFLIRTVSAISKKAPDVLLILFVMNTAAVIAGNLITYHIVRMTKGCREAVCVFFLLLCNSLGYLNVFWPYSNALSIPLLMGIIYTALRCYKADSFFSTVLFGGMTGLLGGISYYIRPTSLIPLIAAFILCFLFLIKSPSGWKKCLGAGASCCVVLAASFFALSLFTAQFFSEEVTEQTFPITHWLMMGSHGNGENTGEDMDFTQSFEGKDAKKEANIQVIIDNYSQNGVSDTIRLYIRKAANSFSDGYSSMDYRLVSDGYFTKLFKYIAGNKKDMFVIYCQCFRIFTLLLLSFFGIGLLSGMNEEAVSMIVALTILGGIAFYCLWEAKNVYSAPFVPVMLIGAAAGLSRAAEKERDEISGRSTGNALLIMILLFFVFSVQNARIFTETPYTEYEYSVRFAGSHMNVEAMFPDMTLEESMSWEQTFLAAHSFSRIAIEGFYTGEGEPAVYTVKISDGNGKELRSVDISEDQAMGTDILCEFEEIEVRESGYYKISVSPAKDGPRKFKFYTTNMIGDNLDFYPGFLTINGTQVRQDAVISVYNEKNTKYISAAKYWIAVVGIIIVWLCSWSLICRKNNRSYM